MFADTRWAFYRIRRFLWWLVNHLPQHDPPLMVLQGGHNFTPAARQISKGAEDDPHFEQLVDRMVEECVRVFRPRP